MLGTSLASVLAAFAAAGLTVATGGAAAVATGAAVAAAGGAGAVGALLGRVAGEEQRALLGRVAGEEQQHFMREQLERGGVLLWVRLPDAAAEPRALDILRRHSAHDVHVHEFPAAASA